MKVQDNALIEQSKLETFAEYVQKHGIFDLFQSMVSKMLIEMPDDPIQFMIDHFSAPKGLLKLRQLFLLLLHRLLLRVLSYWPLN